MENFFTLDSNSYVYLKPKGEICNQLPAGTQVKVIMRKGGWMKINWRKGKKQGWIKMK